MFNVSIIGMFVYKEVTSNDTIISSSSMGTFRTDKQKYFYVYQDFVHWHIFVHTFSQLTIAPNLLWKGRHIHISSVIFAISMMLTERRQTIKSRLLFSKVPS